jgi:hypothetical protein
MKRKSKKHNAGLVERTCQIVKMIMSCLKESLSSFKMNKKIIVKKVKTADFIKTGKKAYSKHKHAIDKLK